MSHIRLHQKLVEEGLKVFPHSRDRIYEMFDNAVNQECLWTNHIMNNDFLGITEESTEQYTKHLANVRLKAIGFDAPYEAKNPYKHLENFADLSNHGTTKANFFESTVTAYSMASAVEGWDEI